MDIETRSLIFCNKLVSKILSYLFWAVLGHYWFLRIPALIEGFLTSKMIIIYLCDERLEHNKVNIKKSKTVHHYKTQLGFCRKLNILSKHVFNLISPQLKTWR